MTWRITEAVQRITCKSNDKKINPSRINYHNTNAINIVGFNLQLKSALLHWSHSKAIINLYKINIPFLTYMHSQAAYLREKNKQRVTTCQLVSAINPTCR